MYGQESWFDRAHNMPLDMLVAGGALGLLSYLAIFISCLYVVWKSKREVFEKALIVGLLAAYFFQNLFVFDNLVSYFLFFTVLSYLYFTETDGKEDLIKVPKKYEDFEMSEDLKNILAIIIVLMLGFTLWWVNIRPIMANTFLIKAMSAQEYSVKDKKVVALTAEQTMESFKKAIAYKTFANPEIREQLLNMSQKVGFSKGVTNETKLAYINYALEEMHEQILKTPNDARYQLFTGSMLNNIGRSDLAMPFLEKAKELSPNKQTIAFELIQSYINLGEKEKARDEAKMVYELDKSIDKPKILYASMLIMSGDEKSALELINTSQASDENITRAYTVRAVDYYKQGLLSQSVGEINKAIKMNPSFEIEGKKMINAIWSKTLQYE
jgi:tetratricopeptide (TPR) repeat protein